MGHILCRAEKPADSAIQVKLPSGDVVELDARVPVVLMSNCDIFVGTIHSGTKVALKRLRERDRPKEDVLQQFRQEEEIWRSVRHANILQFMDAATDSTSNTYLVSPWQQDGTLWDYIQKSPTCDRPKYILETAEALEYLHVEAKVIHGDIKAQNILVSREGRALLCDFGISRYLDRESPKNLFGAGTRQWQSPELLRGEPTSCQSDVYAFGMTIFQVLSGKEPFENYLDAHQIKAVLDGERPQIPAENSKPHNGVSYNYLWAVAQRCWLREADRRPAISLILAWIRSGDLAAISQYTVHPPLTPEPSSSTT